MALDQTLVTPMPKPVPNSGGTPMPKPTPNVAPTAGVGTAVPVGATPMPSLGTIPSGTPFDPMNAMQDSLESFLSPNSRYIQNARQRGMEFAAQRGGINSSIAAGAAERAAIETAQPMVSQVFDAQAQNWLGEQNFNRELQGQLYTLPIINSFNMLSKITDYGLQDPALYTPDVVSGYTNFFNQNMRNMMQNFFGKKP